MKLTRLLRGSAVALVAASVALGAVAAGKLGAAAVALWGGVLAGAGAILAAGLLLVIREIGLSERRVGQRVGQRVDDARAKQSRHEYIQETALSRLETQSRAIAATTSGLAWFRPREQAEAASGGVPRVLFVTSNGGGMGHIARCAAVLRHGRGAIDGRILTMSTAASLVRQAGYEVDYFPSQSTAERGLERWRRQFTRHLLEDLSARPVDSIVFDGTHVYPSLTEAAEFTNLPLVWLRRGLWREDRDLAQVEAWREHVTCVIAPRDIAETEHTAPLPFRDALWVDPISLAPDTLMARDDALAALGLDPSGRYALVQLAGGNADGATTSAAVEAVRAAGGMTPVVVRSPLLTALRVDGAIEIEARFPLVDYASAWDFSITNAGYNSVHENLHTGTPGIYLPSGETVTDAQERRAAAVAEQGRGLAASSVDELPRRIRGLASTLDGDGRISKHGEDSGGAANGARSVATILAATVVGSGGVPWSTQGQPPTFSSGTGRIVP